MLAGLSLGVLMLPTIVYRCPGAHPGPHGKSYDLKGIDDAASLASALVDGWHASLPEACGVVVAPVVPDDDAPTTRAELEKLALDLGLKFDGRTTDALLLKRINDALAGA